MIIIDPTGKKWEFKINPLWPDFCQEIGIFDGWFERHWDDFHDIWLIRNGWGFAKIVPNDSSRTGIFYGPEPTNFERIPGLTKEEAEQRLKLKVFK